MTAPTDKAPPLCRDCKNRRPPYPGVNSKGNPEFALCALAPPEGRPSLVTGALPSYGSVIAADERASTHPQACGPTGRLFKQREGA